MAPLRYPRGGGHGRWPWGGDRFPTVGQPFGAARSASRQPVAALSVTPTIPAERNDLFEDVTEKAGLRFVNQFCDSRIASIIESNGGTPARWIMTETG